MILKKSIKPFHISFCFMACILLLGRCKVEHIDKNSSGLLTMPEKGELQVNYFGQLNINEILMAGSTSTLDADNRQRGIDTGTYYLVDPNNLKYRKIEALNSKTGAVFGSVNTPDNGIILWMSDYNDLGKTFLVRYDKNFKELKRLRIYPKNSLKLDSNLISDAKNNSLLALSDGTFLLLGYPAGTGENHIYKFDIDLNIVWQFTYGIYRSLTAMVESDNGSIIISGESGARACILKLDKFGTIQFIKNTNYVYYSKFNDIKKIDGGFLCAGFYFIDNNNTNFKATIWKYNSKGDTLKTKSFFAKQDSEGWKLISTNDGGFICVFNKFIYSTRISEVVKLDADLNIIWSKSIGDFGEINTVTNIIEQPNGNLVIGGNSNHNENNTYGTDGFVIVLDKDGSIIN